MVVGRWRRLKAKEAVVARKPFVHVVLAVVTRERIVVSSSSRVLDLRLLIGVLLYYNEVVSLMLSP